MTDRRVPGTVTEGRPSVSPLVPWRMYSRLPESFRKRVEHVALLRRLKHAAVGVRSHRVLTVLGALEAEGIEVWLAGGWGVDALAGRQTRRHHDVDLVIGAADAEAASCCLAKLGFTFDKERKVPEALLSKSLVFRDSLGRHVDLHPAWIDGSNRRGDTGAGPILDRGSLGVGSLGGRRVRCLSAAAQIELHGGYEPRPQDISDLAVLREIVG
jgi:lincosamide nucleotidyltransferase A/C/D/E